MQPAITQILGQLEIEIDAYQELLSLVEQEHQILLKGKHDELVFTSEKKLGLVKHLAKLQENRLAIMRGLLPEQAEAPRLKDLEPLLPAGLKSGFRLAKNKMTSLAKRLEAANQANRGFIEEALETVGHLIGIFTSSGRDSNYGPKAPREVSAPPRLLVREV